MSKDEVDLAATVTALQRELAERDRRLQAARDELANEHRSGATVVRIQRMHELLTRGAA